MNYYMFLDASYKVWKNIYIIKLAIKYVFNFCSGANWKLPNFQVRLINAANLCVPHFVIIIIIIVFPYCKKFSSQFLYSFFLFRGPRFVFLQLRTCTHTFGYYHITCFHLGIRGYLFLNYMSFKKREPITLNFLNKTE